MDRVTEFSIKRHVTFEPKELNDFITFGLLTTVVVFLWRWRTVDLDLTRGIQLFIVLMICCFISMFIYVFAQKIIALKSGYIAIYQNSFNGFLFCLFIVFYSAGFLLCLYPGWVFLKHDEKLRLGKFRYGVNRRELAKVAFFGPLTNLLFVILLSFFYVSKTESTFLYILIMINLIIAFFALLPLPKLAGINILFYSFPLWVFIISLIAGYGLIFVLFDKFLIGLSLLLALLMVLIFVLFLKDRL
jgi:Zn-dependent protease